MTATVRRRWGMTLVAVGLLAIPIPVIPGTALIAAGAAMIGSDHPFVRTFRAWLQRRGIWNSPSIGPKRKTR